MTIVSGATSTLAGVILVSIALQKLYVIQPTELIPGAAWTAATAQSSTSFHYLRQQLVVQERKSLLKRSMRHRKRMG
jgi:hypothetical protein